MEKNLPEHEDILVGHEHLEGVDTNLENIDKKSRIRETLNLSTDANSRTDTILEIFLLWFFLHFF